MSISIVHRVAIGKYRSVVAGHLFLLGCALGTACSDGDASAPGGAASGDRLPIVATTSIWGDVTRALACEDSAATDVAVLIPAGGDPHAFEASLRDRETIEESALVVMNGADLEPSLDDMITGAERASTPVFRATDHISLIDGDPHVWMDPTRVRAALPALANALVAAGLDAATVERCRAGYDAELVALDEEITDVLSTLTPVQRQLVTSHEALAYFAERYGFSVVGAVIPGGSTLGETNPAELDELARLVEQTGVRAVFAEEQHSAEDIEVLAAEVGDIEVITLFTDALGEAGTGAETYIGLLRTDAQLIADGLGG